MEGRIIKGIGGFYTVLDAAGCQHTLRAQAKLRRQRMTPLVGDRVRFTIEEDNNWITGILPRENCLVRPPVANVDKLVITVSAGTPKADLLLTDRLLFGCRHAAVSPILVVNKADEGEEEARRIAQCYRDASDGLFVVSALEEQGLEELREALSGTVHAFGGQSGVGKSTLINRLYGLTLTTGALSDRIERGKNTTRHIELICLPDGGMVLDTPGFNVLESGLIEPLQLRTLYPEFLPVEGGCRFETCVHNKEPGCMVKRAVVAGEIDRGRYERYCILYEEMLQRWRERYD